MMSAQAVQDRPRDSLLVRALIGISRQAGHLAESLHQAPAGSQLPKTAQHPESAPAVTERIYSWLEELPVPNAQEIQETQHWDPASNTIRTTKHTKNTSPHLVVGSSKTPANDMLTPLIFPEDSISNRPSTRYWATIARKQLKQRKIDEAVRSLGKTIPKNLERRLRDALERDFDGVQVWLESIKTDWDEKVRLKAIEEGT